MQCYSPPKRVINTLLMCVLISASISFCVSCKYKRNDQSSVTAVSQGVPQIVTGDIQQGIEKHIADEVVRGNGYFRILFEGKELQLKLVRVHIEYLASLSPTSHFACVDMVGADGEFYDVDFFMEGPRGDMHVTETTVHKINGKPLYIWKQAADKTWGRVSVDEANKRLLGVIEGKDSFRFRYEATVPEIKEKARIWIPLAQSDAFQTVKIESITSPVAYQKLTDRTYQNSVLFMELAPHHSGQKIVVLYDVIRLEKGAYAGDQEESRRYLQEELSVRIDETIKQTAQRVVEGKEGDLVRARALYDHVIDSMSYKKCGTGWGQGNAQYACTSRAGNCTDFHAYFIALARAIGIPARFAIGASIPSERNEGGTDGYHCWAEFYAEGKWWPVDISEANKFTSLSMYFFGHHPANRFELSRGRDLVLEPGPQSGPINILAYPVCEADGNEVKVKILFGFERR